MIEIMAARPEKLVLRSYEENGKLNINTRGQRIITKGYSRANQWIRLVDSPQGIKSFLRRCPGIIKVSVEIRCKREGTKRCTITKLLTTGALLKGHQGHPQFKPILTISPDPILVLPSWRPTVWPIAVVHRSATTAFARSW